MKKQFIEVNEFKIINVKFIHSVTLNRDGSRGRVHVLDEGKVRKYMIEPNKYNEIKSFLLANETVEE